MSQDLVDRTEDWFVYHGIPHFIDDFKASEDVWTRAVGFLSLVFLGELFLTFREDVSGWGQALIFLIGIGVALVSVAIVNRSRGRALLTRPDDIGPGELALFVVVPPLLAIVGGHNGVWGFVAVVGFNVAVLALTYLVVAWGVFSMARWGLQTMADHLSGILHLLGRILPLMLLFSAFLFLNAEIWQVVNDLELVLFAVVLAMLGLIGLFFLIGAMRGSIHDLRWFDSWDEVAQELDGTPLAGFDASSFAGRPKRVPLSNAAKANLTVRLVVGLGAQALLVTLLIFGFYVLFGMLTVRSDTILQWTTVGAGDLDDIVLVELTAFGHELILTRLHLIAAALVASFSGLQFAVSLVTDDGYRKEYVAESNAEVREAIAVRSVYLRLVNELAGVSAGGDADTG